jgi:hypothetical protein
MPEQPLLELQKNVRIFDPKTGEPTKDFLQQYNALVRRLRSHETRITTLEP